MRDIQDDNGASVLMDSVQGAAVRSAAGRMRILQQQSGENSVAVVAIFSGNRAS